MKYKKTELLQKCTAIKKQRRKKGITTSLACADVRCDRLQVRDSSNSNSPNEAHHVLASSPTTEAHVQIQKTREWHPCISICI